MIDNRLLDALVRLGESDLPRVPDELTDEREAWRLIMVGHQPWKDLATLSDEPTLRATIRGLLLYAQASRWSGGSVSPVVVLFRTYSERFPEGAPSLGDWILLNRINPDEPLGHHVPLAVRSQKELEEWRRARADERVERRAREVDRQDAASKQKGLRATLRLAAAVRRGDERAVAALLEKGADPNGAVKTGESLVAIAQSSGHATIVEILIARGAG